MLVIRYLYKEEAIEMSISSVIKKRRRELDLTLADVAERMGVSEATVQRWESGAIKNLRHERIGRLADVLQVSPAVLMGWQDEPSTPKPSPIPPGFQPLPEMTEVPIIGRIACGQPITAEENLEGYVDAPKRVHCDFALRCEGDSMIDAGISEGDIVFIRQQPEVPNGQIAAVRIGDEATLKRVYWDGTTLTLMPANPCYAPRTFTGEQLRDVQIEGRAIGYLHLY
jgi:repressor LexA